MFETFHAFFLIAVVSLEGTSMFLLARNNLVLDPNRDRELWVGIFMLCVYGLQWFLYVSLWGLTQTSTSGTGAALASICALLASGFSVAIAAWGHFTETSRGTATVVTVAYSIAGGFLLFMGCILARTACSDGSQTRHRSRSKKTDSSLSFPLIDDRLSGI
jgi:hypothetical protein